MGFWDNFRDGRNQVRAAYGAPLLNAIGGREEPHAGHHEEPMEAGGDAAELQAALAQRDSELEEARQLIGELKSYAEQLEERVGELVAGADPMAKALMLPGVRTFLLTKFHPDKYPDADEHQHSLLVNAIKTINAAYECADKLQTPSSE